MNTIEELQKVVDEMLDKTQAVYDLEVSSIVTDSIEELASRLQSIIDSMKAQEPVAWMRYGSDGNPIDVLIGDEPMEFIHGRNAPLYAAPQVPDGMVLVPEVLLRQISKWLAESADPYDKAAYAINGLIAAAKEEG